MPLRAATPTARSRARDPPRATDPTAIVTTPPARSPRDRSPPAGTSPPARAAPPLPSSTPPRPPASANSVVASGAPSTTRPVVATISTTRRRPPRSSSACATTSIADATVGTTNPESMLRPASSGRVDSFASASRAWLAWIEHMPGSPEFSAISRSSDSASRTSPTTRRSGRIRRASLISRRRVISPVPSRLGWRHCIATQSGLEADSSKVSSTVTTRSSGRALASSAPSSVVLPDCVAPDTRMFCPLRTQRCKNSAACFVSEPSRVSSRRSRMPRRNLRTLTAQCARVMSGMTTCSRDPSGSEASTNGELRSTRRPVECSIRSTSSRTCNSVRARSTRSETPSRAMNTRSGPLIQSSSTLGSSRNGWSGPNPVSVATTWRVTAVSSERRGCEPPNACSL